MLGNNDLRPQTGCPRIIAIIIDIIIINMIIISIEPGKYGIRPQKSYANQLLTQ